MITLYLFLEDKEKLREELRKHIREFAGANEDDSDEEIREKFMKGFLEEMKQNGFDIKTDDTTEGFQELKKQVTAQLKDMGFDLEEGKLVFNFCKNGLLYSLQIY